MLEESQIKQIKSQLISQIQDSEIPNKDELISSIEKMASEELENFLKQNKLVSDDSECVFCSIIQKKIPSFAIGENNHAMGVLEINPVSKGHSMVIPKIHAEESTKEAIDFAKEIAERLKVLKPEKIDIVPSKMFGHEVLNIIPVYKDESLKSKRKKESENELKKLQEKLLPKTKKQSPKKEIKHDEEKPVAKEQPKQNIISDKTHWLPKRFP
ncbi:MAG: HIT domain-containing protein [Nanoarchaeota archaeon]